MKLGNPWNIKWGNDFIYTNLIYQHLAHPNCTMGQFACENGQCVDAEKECNLIKDCEDGSDEAICSKITF